MSQKGEPAITPCSSDDNWTSISFTPDLARFGMEGLEEDTVALMRKRVYDIAGILGKGVKVRGLGSWLGGWEAVTLALRHMACLGQGAQVHRLGWGASIEHGSRALDAMHKGGFGCIWELRLH